MAKINELGIKLKDMNNKDMNNTDNNKQQTQMSQEELQLLYLQIQQLQQEIEATIQQKKQFQLMLESVEDLEKLDNNEEKESIISLVPGIFMKAKIKKPEKLILNIGQNILVEKSFEETKKIIKDQISTIEKNEKILKDSFNNLIKNLPQ